MPSWENKRKKTGPCEPWAVMCLGLASTKHFMETWGSEKDPLPLMNPCKTAKKTLCDLHTTVCQGSLKQSEVCWVIDLTGDSAQLHVKALIIYPNCHGSLVNTLPLCSPSAPLTCPGCCTPFQSTTFQNPPRQPLLHFLWWLLLSKFKSCVFCIKTLLWIYIPALYQSHSLPCHIFDI